MFTSFEDSLIAHTDSEGRLQAHLVRQLLNEHGFTVSEWVKDCESRGKSDELLDHAETILEWLGY